MRGDMPEESRREVVSALMRQKLEPFLAAVMQTVDPGVEYLSNWHIGLMAEYLQAVARGEVRRLVINLPPRSLKSVTVSVAWPAWLLGQAPDKRIICASYSMGLAEKHSTDTRLVMQSEWYRAVFPKTRIRRGENRKGKLVTTRQGFRLATSVGGTLTGEGGDILIADDLLNPEQALSDVRRKAAIRWFDQTFLSRLNKPSAGAVVLVMQRLHPEDITAHVLEGNRQQWEHVCLPAVTDRTRRMAMGDVQYLWRVGEALHPARMPEAWVQQARSEMGEAAFEAQYMQRPAPPGGSMVKRAWLRYYVL